MAQAVKPHLRRWWGKRGAARYAARQWWARMRQPTAFGFLSAAAWTVGTTAGLLAIGVSLLILNTLAGGKR